MKKRLFLLTSFLITGTAITPLLTQTKVHDATFETTKSLDVINLTMPWWASIKVDAPNLTQLLNNSIGHSLQDSKMILTAPDDIVIEATSSFDNGSLNSLLVRNVHFNNVQLQFSSKTAYENYIMAYFTTPDSNKSSAVVINRFNWSTVDKIDHFWTKDVKFEFELNLY